jgi:DNA-binding MarR family transcriptional regulator
MQAGRLAMELTARALAERELTLHEYAALTVIQRFGGISQGVVAERLGLSKATLSGIATRLEGRDLISRTQHARFRKRVDKASLQALAELPPRDLTPIELALRYCQ